MNRTPLKIEGPACSLVSLVLNVNPAFRNTVVRSANQSRITFAVDLYIAFNVIVVILGGVASLYNDF